MMDCISLVNVKRNEMDNTKRKFLAGLVADAGKILLGIGAITQIYSKKPDWFMAFIGLAISTVMFISAFFIHPREQG